MDRKKNTHRKVAIVTGGIRGIGLAIAERLHKEGYYVIVTGTKVDANLSHISFGKESFEYFAADFSVQEELDAFIDYVKTIENIDICINNAGINIITETDKISPEDFDKLHSINLRAPFLISQAVARSMSKNKIGKIVNIASIWSKVSKKGRLNYCSAKSGLVGMTRAMATDLATDNILVNCVSPGFTLTELTKKSLSEKEMNALREQIPLKRMATPNEIANIVWFICSPENSYLTGQNIVVDGGYTNV